LAAAAAKRADRWRRIVQQASEQSRRPTIPLIGEAIKVKEAVREAATTRILLSEAEQEVRLHDAMRSHPASESVLLAVGPEGGWTEEELTLFGQHGWISASLGDTILRAETAAMAATAIAISALT
jgi:16S rRNA (uracil1498-N3)-methyltransferase